MRKLVIALGLMLPLASLADITGQYEMPDGKTMTMHYRDSDTLRMDMGPDQFMLVDGDKVYSVQKQNGGWMAVDMSSMGKMMQQMGFQPGAQGQGQPQKDESGDYEFRKTGRSETVAGYEGEVYESVAPNGDTQTMVLGDHKDIRNLTRGWVQFSGKMMSNMGVGSDKGMDALLEDGMFDKLGGMLRVEDGMTLKSVDTADKPDSFFALPPGTEVQDMSGMGGMMQGR